ncbi:MAG: hypothetical protein WD823_12650 [Sulfuricaulis sp.]|uniref:hypothetical protein n=1 Tax=Sulfuricaulis sp. TaxID=2003553 RepID=UPI0034A28EA4
MNEKTAPLQEGDLYVVKQGRLMHVEREGDLPKVPVSEAAKDALLQLRRRCRHALGGFRPDVALVASALIQYAASLPQAETIVRDYDEAIRGALRQPNASSLDSASC